MPSIETDSALVDRTYRTVTENLDVVRERLGRPMTYAEKILLGHLDDPRGQELVAGESYDGPDYRGDAYLAAGEVEAHHAHPGWFSAIAYSLGVIGIGVGIVLFKSGKRDEKSRLLPKGLHELSLGKFYMDEFYLDAVVASLPAEASKDETLQRLLAEADAALKGS